MDRSILKRLGAVATLILAAVVADDGSAQWLNETGQPGEADFVNIQFPSTLSVQASQQSEFVYGQLYEAGLTELNGPAANVLADLGYGPSGSDPRSAVGWTWFPAAHNFQVGNNDEYKTTLTAPAIAGTYSYAFRFSLDNGSTWTAADLDGAGANAGLAFSSTQLGVMTVTGSTNNDVDYAVLQFPQTLNLQASQSSGSVYGIVYEAGMTSIPGEPESMIASLGYGPANTDPRTSAAWSWSAANYNAQIGNNDEFFGSFAAPAVNGSYSFTYRFSLNGGATWTVADLDGAGTNAGLSFDPNLLGLLTVTGGVDPGFHPADFNEDGDVDGLDLAAWKPAFAKNNGADADNDGDTDGADFLRWQRSVGAGSATVNASPAPEPTSAALIAVSCVAFRSIAKARRGRGRRRLVL
jgi:hypothetical protein